MSRPLVIDFVGDISCPWCALGLASLLKAIEQVKGEIPTLLQLHPFELDSTMSDKGEITEAMLQKRYGKSLDDIRQSHAAITEKGQMVGFKFNFSPKSRTWNTFDAHRLLQWAKTQGKMLELTQALYVAHFTDNEDISDKKVLAKVAKSIGLKESDAKRVIEKEEFSKDVRVEQQFFAQRNVNGVPAVILDQKWIHQGAEAPEYYVGMLERAFDAREGETAH